MFGDEGRLFVILQTALKGRQTYMQYDSSTKNHLFLNVNKGNSPSQKFASIKFNLPARETTIPPATGGYGGEFHRATKKNPCFCGKTRDCKIKQNGELILCRTYIDRYQDPHHPEWEYRGETKDGIWGKFTPRREKQTQQGRDIWLENARKRKAEREQEKAKRAKTALSIEDRGKGITDLSAERGLTDGDRQLLNARGLTDEQIATGLFFSYEAGRQVSNRIPGNLPGIRGGKLAGKNPGIACPAFDGNGLAIGYQIRLTGEVTGGKYRWGHGQVSSHLPNGELPLNVVKQADPNNPHIHLMEGILKPYVASCRLNINCIGASGGNHAGSPEQLKAAIDGQLTDDPGQFIAIMPDAGAIQNPNVLRQYEATAKLISDWGYGDRLRFGWWGQVNKSDQDIDEIDGDRQIYYIDKAGFEYQKCQAVLHEEHNKLNTLSLTPNILVNNRYFPPLAEMTKDQPLPKTGILSVLGAKGSGKTTLIKDTKNHYVSLGYEVVSIVPRVSLGRSQGNILDLQCFNDLKDTGMISGEVNTCMRNMTGVVLCPESLHRIQGRDFTKPHLIILDEVEQTLKQILTSSTIKNKPKTLKIFQETIKTVLDNGGIVLLSDADLTDVSVDYINDLGGGNIPTFLIKNEVKPQPINIDFYQGNHHDIKARIFDDLTNGKKLVIPTDSKGEAQAIARAIQAQFPDKIIMEINGDTTQEPIVKGWVGDMNPAIETVKPDVLIYTGSLGTGVSIDVDWFNQGYGIFFHQEPNDCGQSMARVRSPIPWAIYAKEYVARDESHRSYRPDVIKRNTFKDKESGLDLIGLARELAGENADDMEILATLNSMMKDGQWDNPHINLFAKIKARQNYAVSQLSDNLLAKLTAEGHNITIHQDDGPNAISTSIKEAKKEIKLEESAAIANAPDLTDQELKSLRRKSTTTKDERAKITKALISRELPGMDLTAGFVYDWIVKDHRKKLNATKLFLYCQNPAIAKELDIKEWRYRLKQFGDGCPYLPDVKTFSTKVKTINDVGLFDLIDITNPDREYRSTDGDVQAFMSRCYLHRYRLNRSLGVTVTSRTEPLALLGRLARRVGLGFTKKQYREGDDRVWAYKLDSRILENPEREKILKILAKKYAESQSEKGFPVSQNFSEGSNNHTESSVTDLQPKTQPTKPSTLPNVDRLKTSPQSTWDEIISTNNDQIAQLGWDVDTAGQILKEKYGHGSRLKLTDAQLFDWLDYCQSLLLIQISKKVG